MGKYIGRSNPYGLFETQVLNAGTGSGSGPTSYNLTYRVSSASSLLVVKAGNILQPETEYTLSNGGEAIVFTTAPSLSLPLYVTYLGRELATSPAAAIPDGSKGDFITVSGEGALWNINNNSITYNKIQPVSTGDRILGRTTGGTGTIQEIPCTAQARSLLAAETAADQRTVLGLGTLATQSGTFSGTSSGNNTGDQNIFRTIQITGTAAQDPVIADTTTDILTLNAGTGITLNTNAATDTITINATTLSDGAKGAFITVSGSGSTWNINDGSITFSKIQNVTGPVLLGKESGTGSVQTLALGNNFTISSGTLGYTPIFADGTFAQPSITFTNETGTGIFRAATNTLGFSTGAVERMRIDSSGRVGIGMSPSEELTVGSSTSQANISLETYLAGSGDASYLHLRKSKGTSVGAQAIVVNGETLGGIRWWGSNGTSFSEAARIVGIVDAAPGATNDMPGGLLFQTTLDGTSSPTTRMYITNTGNIGINGTPGTAFKLDVFGSDSTSSNYSFRASTSTSTAFSVRNDGRVGIDTDSPLTKFHLSGGATEDIRYRIGDNVDFLEFIRNGTTANTVSSTGSPFYIRTTDAQSLILRTNDTDRLTISSTGNVGIGGSAAQALHVYRGASDGIVAQFTRTSGQSAYIYANTTSAYFTSDGSGNTALECNESSDSVSLWTGGSQRLLANSSGNVGIGVTPSVRFHVRHDVTGTSGSYIQNLDQILQLQNYYSAGIGQYSFIQASNSALSSPTNLALQPNGGNLGIGYAFPAYYIHARTTSNSPVRFVLENYNAGSSAQTRFDLLGDVAFGGMFLNSQFNTTGPGAFGLGVYSELGGIQLSASGPITLNNGANRFRVESNGTKIFENGNIFILNTAITNGIGNSFIKYHTTTGVLTWDASSALVKSNIVDCPYGLNSVLELQPRKYFRTDDNQDEIGFVADEVANVIPELVYYMKKSLFTKDENDTDDVPGTLAYEKLTAVLCKAIQELNTRVNELQTRLEELE
jgi:hypothetical protein